MRRNQPEKSIQAEQYATVHIKQGHSGIDLEIGLNKYGAPLWKYDTFTNVAALPVSIDHFGLLALDSCKSWKLSDSSRRKLDEGEPILSIGYSDFGYIKSDLPAINDDYPIVRSGIIARIRDTLSKFTVFFIDSRTIDGDEGGPTFLHPWPHTYNSELIIAEPLLVGVVGGHLFVDRPDRDGEENANLTWVCPIDVVEKLITIISSGVDSAPAVEIITRL